MKIPVLLLFALASLGVSQPLAYRLLPAGDTAPSGRVDGTIAYAASTRRVYLFGGQDNDFRNDLWVYSLDDERWSAVTVSGGLPPARLGHTLLWDARRNRLVLFGGQSRSFFSDVWAFDVAQGRWQQLSRDDAGPSRRYGHSAILEPGRDRMVVSHGFTNSGRFDDTWAFDLGANTWRNLTPSGTKPLRRCLHHAVYDQAGGQMLLYGGCASGFGPCPLADLWSFNLSTNQWTERPGSVKPPGREHYGMAYDDVRARLVLFGGSGGGLLNDTWEFGPSEWRPSTIEGAPPSARSRHQGVFAADRGTAIFFGGRTSAGVLSNELWALGAAVGSGPRVTREGVVSVFGSVAAPVAPGQLVSIFGSGLGPLEGTALGLEGGSLPTAASGVTVTLNGVAAPLAYVRAEQLNVQVPYELAGAAEARLVVTVNGQTGTVTLPVSPARPALFPGAWNQDGTVNSAERPARGGEVIALFATGQGVTLPASRTGRVPQDGYPEPAAATSLAIGGQAAEVLFRGQAPGTVGVMQINARIPAGLASGMWPVMLRVGEAESPAGATIAVR